MEVDNNIYQFYNYHPYLEVIFVLRKAPKRDLKIYGTTFLTKWQPYMSKAWKIGPYHMSFCIQPHAFKTFKTKATS